MADQPTHDDATNEPIPGGEAQQVLPPEAHVRSQIDTDTEAAPRNVPDPEKTFTPDRHFHQRRHRSRHHSLEER